MDVFIDTNIFLSFYHLTSEQLGELEKLAVLISKKKMRLLLPEQVKDEFRRNRESKIAESLKGLAEQKLTPQFPRLCMDYPEYKLLEKHQQEYAEQHQKLLSRIRKDSDTKALRADKIIQKLFGGAEIIQNSDEIMRRAIRRRDIGNPPGKPGSLCDALVWEALKTLDALFEPLYFISSDGDYRSPLDDTRFNEFLLDEWKREKGVELVFYQQLSRFFRDHFPEIKLPSELEKHIAIEDFINSGSFDSTHKAVASLEEYSGFSPSEINRMVKGALSNSQIRWIIRDPDVKKLLVRVTQGQEQHIAEDDLIYLRHYLEYG